MWDVSTLGAERHVREDTRLFRNTFEFPDLVSGPEHLALTGSLHSIP